METEVQRRRRGEGKDRPGGRAPRRGVRSGSVATRLRLTGAECNYSSVTGVSRQPFLCAVTLRRGGDAEKSSSGRFGGSSKDVVGGRCCECWEA